MRSFLVESIYQWHCVGEEVNVFDHPRKLIGTIKAIGEARHSGELFYLVELPIFSGHHGLSSPVSSLSAGRHIDDIVSGLNLLDGALNIPLAQPNGWWFGIQDLTDG